MSIIQKIQDKGAWIISVLIGIALVAFIMMDYSKGGNGGIFSNNNVLGKVNGEKIDITDFNQKVDEAAQSQQAQNQPREAIQDYVWNAMVKRVLLQQAYDKLGLISTSKDLSVAIGMNPTQTLKQAFTDPQTGQYDGQRASQTLNDIKRRGTPQQKQRVAELINKTNDEILLAKYQSLLYGGVYVPTWLAEKTNADNNAIAKVSYVQVPYTTVSDSAVKVTDEDINTYIAAHKKMFEQKDETRNISVITFNAGASSGDSANVLASINALKESFATTKDDSAFVASKGGIIPYTNSYISSAQMMADQIPYAQVLNTPVDSLYGPYVFNGNYILAKMISKITMPDTVKVRHILVATIGQDPQTGQTGEVRSDSDAVKRLDSAVAAIKAGASFDSIAAKYSDDPGSAQKGGVYDNVVSGKFMPEFNNFIFSGKTGDTKIIKTQYGYHYVEILAQKGSTEGYKIASISKSIDPAQSTIDSVDNLASAFVAANQSQQAFEQSAKQKNMSLIPVNGLKENDYQIGNIGVNRDLVKWAYSHKVGEVSQPVHIGSNVIVAELTADVKAGVMDAASARPYVQAFIANQKKAKIIIASKFKGNSLTDYATSAGVAVQNIDSLSFQSGIIPNVGNEPKVVGAAFNSSLLNKVSTPIAGYSGVFAIEPLSISAKSSMDGGPDQIKMIIMQTQIQQSQRTFMDALQKSATVVDKRSKFF